jgi:hypothetical protein
MEYPLCSPSPAGIRQYERNQCSANKVWLLGIYDDVMQGTDAGAGIV